MTIIISKENLRASLRRLLLLHLSIVRSESCDCSNPTVANILLLNDYMINELILIFYISGTICYQPGEDVEREDENAQTDNGNENHEISIHDGLDALHYNDSTEYFSDLKI